MENSLPLNECRIKRTDLIFNRLHTFLHGFALLALFYYRIETLFRILKGTNSTLFLPYFVLFISELVLSFIWLLAQASKWRPVTRIVFPERLPGNEELPSIDVFVCTADPEKEPIVQVMNTVLSAMAMDYPSGKLHVYLSDDAGSYATLCATREAWRFSRVWIPFCRKYEIKNRCPEDYFSTEENGDYSSSEFDVEKLEIEKRYKELKGCLMKITENANPASREHPPMIQVINDINSSWKDANQEDMPFLAYTARERSPSHPHHFKAGALNVLLRASAMISNSPYILVLDCDMYCNDPTSARQAMCFYLDSKISQKLAFVQFPQKFHNISENDILDGRLRFVWQKWDGLDGLQGPVLSGTGFYMNRKALYGTNKIQEDVDIAQLQKSFGSSNEFIKTMYTSYRPNFSKEGEFYSASMLKEMQLLISCTYGDGTLWGQEVGFRYISLVEDYFTGLSLHREGWVSVYMDPVRPCFLGTSPTCLNDFFVQHTRWYVGLMQVALSRFSPLLFGVKKKMSVLQSMCYAELAYLAVNFFPLYCFAIVPQLCLIYDIPLYPKVSSPFFLLFLFIFLSSQTKHLQEIISFGHSINSLRHSINTWGNEQRIWMMRSMTCCLYATLNTILEKSGFAKYSFQPTNKTVDDEQVRRYQLGIYDFQTSALFMVPLCSLYTLNAVSFIIGIARILRNQSWEDMLIQTFIPLFGMTVNYPLLEGMVLRKDKGRVLPSISLISAAVGIFFLCSFSLLVSFY
ncbi:quillaic acid 3-O-glycosyltransferase CSL1-like isoform X1 [Primulina tabacum]|uniref:quillaic acid 3-O-glycosyltransferase CSL1-like isoform X1 n=1 Tax=Primulina tabacum TaxID=48773 RepID=UPI003F5AC099